VLGQFQISRARDLYIAWVPLDHPHPFSHSQHKAGVVACIPDPRLQGSLVGLPERFERKRLRGLDLTQLLPGEDCADHTIAALDNGIGNGEGKDHPLFAFKNSLLDHPPGHEGTGGIAYDSAGTHDGTIYGAAWTTGKLGGALDFDGVNDYVDCGNNGSLNLSEVTISVWIKTGSTDTAFSTILTKGIAYDENFGMHIRETTGLIGFEFSSEGTYTLAETIIDSSTNILDLSWHNAVGSFNGSVLKLYIDGSLQTTGLITVKKPDANISQILTVGVRNEAVPTYYFDGTIDDVRIYDRALTAEEVEQLYQPLTGLLFGDDYHLLSERGRHWPAHDVWILDKVTSPCVDGGDPNVEPSNEPMPNGGRINMGAYGNTAYASMSEWPIEEDNNRDGIVNMLDIANVAARWLEKLDWVE